MKVLLRSFHLNCHTLKFFSESKIFSKHFTFLVCLSVINNSFIKFCQKKAVEDAGGKTEEVTQDEDKLNQDLKDLREALEEKSKKLTERTEGAAKYDIFNSGIRDFSL